MNILHADIEQELKEYIGIHDLQRRVTDMVEKVLLEQPKRPLLYMIKYLRATYPAEADEPKVAASEADSSSEDDEDDYIDELPTTSRRGERASRRVAVSAEAGVDPSELRAQWAATKKSYPKSEVEISGLKAILKKNIMFSQLDDEQTTIVIESLFPVEFHEGDTIIQQGDVGDLFYVVESGSPEVYVKVAGNDSPVRVLTYGRGDSFGELALMYNAPRAATIKAADDCKLWALDRLTFKVRTV